jgi:hypothetical protein
VLVGTDIWRGDVARRYKDIDVVQIDKVINVGRMQLDRRVYPTAPCVKCLFQYTLKMGEDVQTTRSIQ